MNKNTHCWEKKEESPEEEVDSCPVKWRALLRHSFPEVTNEIVMRFTLAHCRLVHTRRRDGVCIDSHSLTSGIQLSSWFRFGPAFSAFVLVLLVQCSFSFTLLFSACYFFFLFTHLQPFHSSLSLPPPTFLSSRVVCDVVWRKLNRIA